MPICAGEAENFIEEISEALKSNKKIDRKHAQSMFIGPGGSGKSSLMYRLINK